MREAVDFEALTAADLEIAARRLADWELVAYWRQDLPTRGAKHGVGLIEWNTNCRTPGYDLIRKGVTAIVNERLAELITEALDRIELDARRAVSHATLKREDTPAFDQSRLQA